MFGVFKWEQWELGTMKTELTSKELFLYMSTSPMSLIALKVSGELEGRLNIY